MKKIAGLLMILGGAACSAATPAENAHGSAEVLAVTSSALSQADVTRVALAISGDGISPAMTSSLARVGSKWQGTIGGIPAGIGRLFHADAHAATDELLYAGELGGVEIRKNEKAFVALVLQQVRKPDPFRNSAPQIDAVYASTDTVEPGAAISVSASATDPDNDPLTFSWTATSGAFAASAATATSWTAPASEGPQTLTLRVRDSKGASAAISFIVHVRATSGQGSAVISASFNDAPTVESMTIDQTPINVGQTVHLGATTADIDGDAVTGWEWSSTCVGAFDDLHAAAPAFTMTALSGSSCAFGVKITDARGGWNTGQLSVAQGAPVSVSNAPVVDTTFQASDVADGGQALPFRAKGHDPLGGSVTYEWSADSGTVGPATTDASGQSEVTWTAPACMAGDAHVSVKLTAPSGASTTQTFTIAPGASTGCTASLRPIERASVSTAGLESNGPSYESSLSRDGRYVAFETAATNLVPELNGDINILLRDLVGGSTILVGLPPTPGVTGVMSRHPSLSADGRYLAFEVAVYGDAPPALTGIYVRDLQTGVTQKVVDLTTNWGFRPSISADGKHICFHAQKSLVPEDTNNLEDVYVVNLVTSTTRLVSRAGAYTSRGCAISGDGRFVVLATNDPIDPSDAYPQDTNNGYDAYVFDMADGSSRLVSSGTGQLVREDPVISADGRWVAYTGIESLPPGAPVPPGPRRWDVYVRDLQSGSVRAISGGTGPMDAFWPAISEDGSVVAFMSGIHTYAFTASTSTLTLLDRSVAGEDGNNGSGEASISGNGRYVAFISSATNLVPGDTNLTYDVFVSPVQ